MDSVRHLYQWEQIEGWRLLERHFQISDATFSLIVVFAPDNWGVGLVREHLAEKLGGAAALARVRFDPAAKPARLSEELLAFDASSENVQVVWIDSDPAEAGQTQELEHAWQRTLSILNRYRNALQHRFHCTLAIALPSRLEESLRASAPDIWSIRAGVFRIEPPGGSRAGLAALPLDERTLFDHAELLDDTGDSSETLAAADKLRGKPGREILLATLLMRAGNQARNRFDWKTAESCLQEAYSLQLAGGADPELRWHTAMSLANLFRDIAQYDRAEYYFRQSLRTAEEHFGLSADLTAVSLNNLALLLHDLNRLTEAEPLLRRALTIGDLLHGPDDPKIARRLNNLGLLLYDMKQLREAESLLRRALVRVSHFFAYVERRGDSSIELVVARLWAEICCMTAWQPQHCWML